MFRIRIWTISLLAMFLLTGCAASTDDLLKEAQLTGDWSLVNSRMEALERREAQDQPSCPRDKKLWCFSRLDHEECSCVSDSMGRDRFESILGL
jgi:hypothetical protein